MADDPRPPGITVPGPTTREGALDALEYEFLAEKAASLGRAEKRMAAALARLAAAPETEERAALAAAAEAVYAYFVQRELLGFRRHDEIVRDHAIPRRVLARLGAR